MFSLCREDAMVSRDGVIAAYMMANRRHGAIYIGVSGNLILRVQDHREGRVDGHTKTYGLKRLVWFQPHELMTEAIRHEKRLKRYLRDWKINLIERANPDWADLYPGLIDPGVAWQGDHNDWRDWRPRAPDPPKRRALPKGWNPEGE
ncbi:GIY-YIG nuclease family protein [Brevundimonas sp. Root1279]|uniref:GIY-YIG nuclease family protein n=1 Tax=Brevundimonas sp. Root1279 TaxID=1736443 RepID=UPI0009E89459|nr:GIY-YIG nuclease family protein [Brevundimonas sp. Root1279]